MADRGRFALGRTVGESLAQQEEYRVRDTEPGPQTEAGRAMLNDWQVDELDLVSLVVQMRERVLAIEAEAANGAHKWCVPHDHVESDPVKWQAGQDAALARAVGPAGPWRAGGVNVYRAEHPEDPTDFSGRAIAWTATEADAFRIAAALNEAEAALLARPVDPDYAELERLARAATPGPWGAKDLGLGEGAASFGRFSVVNEGRGYPAAYLEGIRAVADAAYIAAASPATVLALLARRAPGDRATLEAENAQLRELLALRPSGHTGPLDNRIPWFIHCGISHGADRPDCIACRALAADSRPEQPAPRDNRELAARFWVHYRCGMVGCEIVEQHGHWGGPPSREMTPEERAPVRPEEPPPFHGHFLIGPDADGLSRCPLCGAVGRATPVRPEEPPR